MIEIPQVLKLQESQIYLRRLFIGLSPRHGSCHRDRRACNLRRVNGATVSAILYSLVRIARTNKLKPHAYLRRLFAELPAMQIFDEFESLLPKKSTFRPSEIEHFN